MTPACAGRIAAFQIGRRDRPTGVVSVARMPLTVLPGAELGSSSEVALRLSTVADADGNAIAATVVAAGVSVADCPLSSSLAS